MRWWDETHSCGHSDTVDANLPAVVVNTMVAGLTQQHTVFEIGGPGIPPQQH